MVMAATSRTADVSRAEFEALLTRVAMLERGHGPRDAADVALVAAIHRAAGDLPFRAKDVFDRARDVLALRFALQPADIENTKQLGKLLARLHGVPLDGLVVERVR